MAVIVEHSESGARYVLVGTGFGIFRTAKPSWFFGNLVPDKTSGERSVVAVCDEDGTIRWFKFQELVVVSIDGEAPGRVLGSA
jgi:hypothetical protein